MSETNFESSKLIQKLIRIVICIEYYNKNNSFYINITAPKKKPEIQVSDVVSLTNNKQSHPKAWKWLLLTRQSLRLVHEYVKPRLVITDTSKKQ